MAMASKILIVVESQNEINRIFEISKETNLIPRLALRINPAFEMKSSGMKMGGGSNPFGIDSEKILDCLVQLDKMKIKLEGLHFYLGSQNLSAEVINTTFSNTVTLLTELSTHFKYSLKSINLGGGFGIPYFEGEIPLDLESMKLPFLDEITKLRLHYPNSKLSIELGRFITGESGIYVSKIIDKKNSRNSTFIILDGGMNHQLAATGNLGQVIKRHYPIANLNKNKKNEKEIVSISGPLCTPLDSFGKDIEIDQCEIGDFIGVFQSGAYGLSSSPNGFLSHGIAREIII